MQNKPLSHLLFFTQTLFRAQPDDEEKGEISYPYSSFSALKYQWQRERIYGSLLEDGTADATLTIMEGAYIAELNDDIHGIIGILKVQEPEKTESTYIGDIIIKPSKDFYVLNKYPNPYMAPCIYWLLNTTAEKMRN